MTKSAIQLRRELKEMWPSLRHIWFFDRQYELPSVDQLKALVEVIKTLEVSRTTLEALINVGDVWDCDDFSILSTALMRLRWKQEHGDLPIPYGRAMGSQFRGQPILHSLNICFTQDGIYFIDFDDGGRTWKADPEHDSIFFVSV